MNTSVAVVVPVYKTKLSYAENISLDYLSKHLSDYQIILIKPPDLDVAPQFSILPNLSIETCEKEYFRGVKSYSQLLLSEKFYQRFIAFDYILISQLDALVLKANLDYWVKQNYDYIGAHWNSSIISFLTNKSGRANAVGNGGFSLRKVSSHLETIRIQNKKFNCESPPLAQLARAILSGKSRSVWFKSRTDKYPFNEDGYWSLEASKVNPKFKVAPVNVAQRFAWEKNSRKLYEKSKRLPFGVHAWQRYDEDFWRETLELPSNI